MSIIESIFGKARKKPMELKVCMMGPRAVGKTSILTAIFSDSEQSLSADTNLQFCPVGPTADQLIERRRLFNAIFHDKVQITDEPASGQTATPDVTPFDFKFGLKGAVTANLIDVSIKDFPGEYVSSRPNDVQEFINESTAIFIAVDTPYLMEHGGKYAEGRNQIKKITEFMKSASLSEERLVLIVPLKCERYFYDKRMPEVLSKIKEYYSDLIKYLSDSLKICCAVTPILTLGGVEYSHTDNDNLGNVIIDRITGLPVKLHYKFRNPAQYKPRFCVQPLYYMLSFMASQYERNLYNGSWWNRLMDFILADNERLRDEIFALDKYRCVSAELGYSTLCGGNLLVHH